MDPALIQTIRLMFFQNKDMPGSILAGCGALGSKNIFELPGGEDYGGTVTEITVTNV